MTPDVRPGTNPYPAQWQRVAQTRDGVEYHIRPIQSADTLRERAFIVGLSETSRHNRLMGGLREPSLAMLEHAVHAVRFLRAIAQCSVSPVRSGCRSTVLTMTAL